MNQKQAKRLRRSARRYIAENKHKLTTGPTAKRQAEILCRVVTDNWHLLNHKQRGRVIGRIVARGL